MRRQKTSIKKRKIIFFSFLCSVFLFFILCLEKNVIDGLPLVLLILFGTEDGEDE